VSSTVKRMIASSFAAYKRARWPGGRIAACPDASLGGAVRPLLDAIGTIRDSVSRIETGICGVSSRLGGQTIVASGLGVGK